MSKNKRNEQEFKIHLENEEYFSRPKKVSVVPKNSFKHVKNINTKDLEDILNDNEDNYLL